MKAFLILFFCSVALCQGAESTPKLVPQQVTEISPGDSINVPFPVPEPSTVLLSIMAGALGVLRRKRS